MQGTIVIPDTGNQVPITQASGAVTHFYRIFNRGPGQITVHWGANTLTLPPGDSVDVEVGASIFASMAGGQAFDFARVDYEFVRQI